MTHRSGSEIHRILMTVDTVGGVWTYALELARALRFHEVEVAFASMGTPPDEFQRREAAGLENVILHESGYRLEWMRDPWDDVQSAARWLLELEAKTQPDIVHLNGYVHAALPWKAPVLVVGHSCVSTWFAAVKGQAPPESWDRYRSEVGRGLRAARAVTAPTGAMLSLLRESYGPFAGEKSIPNGRDPRFFAPGVKEPFIMAVGRIWDEGKNMRVLERAVPSLEWPVYAAGDCTHPDGGTMQLDGVRHLGKLDTHELASWLGRASIFVLPARYEPFGFTALEAGLSGCALVLGDIPSLREVWEKNALYVPPDRPDLLTATLEKLIRNDSLRMLLAHRARARALEFSPEHMACEYMNLYTRMTLSPITNADEGVGEMETESSGVRE